MRVITLVCACALLLSAPAWAGSVTLLEDPGTTQITGGLAGFSTFGGNLAGVDGGPAFATNDMDGLSVTAIFANGSTETAIWKTTAVGTGKAVGTGWEITLTGDTYWPFFLNTWDLDNASGKTMSRLVLDGGPGDTVFDRFTLITHTPGSADGGDFLPFALDGSNVISSFGFNADGTYVATFNGFLDLDIRTTYRDQVAISGNAPLGDIWRVLDIDFGSGLASNRTFQFGQDTDNLELSGDLRPIPEPGTLALLGMGAAGLLARRRRRRKA